MFAFLRHFLYVIHGCLKDALVNPNDSSADLEVQLVITAMESIVITKIPY